MPRAGELRYATAAGRWVVAAAVLGSAMAFIDSQAVTVALPAIAQDLDTDLTGLQWTADSYLLTLVAFLLIGGSLGDRYGRRRMFVAGVVSFAIASAACALAPTTAALVGARALQGAGAALMVPVSLALVSATFVREDRGAAIGAWSAMTSAAAAAGPVLGGFLVTAASWRVVFLINLPVAVAAVAIARAHVPESGDLGDEGRLDIPGAVLAALALSGIVFALIEGPRLGFGHGAVAAAGAGGLLALAAFFAVQTRSSHPMLPLHLFRNRDFSGSNAATLAIYFAIGGALFLTVIQMQGALAYSAFETGAALIPFTALLVLLSPTMGKLIRVVTPRIPMTVGPIVAAAGLALFARAEPGSTYLGAVLPAIAAFGLGVAITVAPLTTTVLGAVEDRYEGIASAANNAVARLAGFLAVALLPIAGGIAGVESLTPAELSDGFRRAILVAAAACAAGGLVAFATVRRPALRAGEIARGAAECQPH